MMNMTANDTIRRLEEALRSVGITSFSVVDENEVRVPPQMHPKRFLPVLERMFPSQSVDYNPIESTITVLDPVPVTADIEIDLDMEILPVKPRKIRELIQATLQALKSDPACPKCRNKGWYIGPDGHGYPGTLHLCEDCKSIEYEDDAAHEVVAAIRQLPRLGDGNGCGGCGGRRYDLFDSGTYGFELQTCDDCVDSGTDLAGRILRNAATALNRIPGSRTPRSKQDELF